jgi:hypothetical protein
MTCVEFERVLPEFLEGDHASELEAHLNSCPACSNLLADLNSITSQAPLLQEADEPSPRVWNAIEAQLRREGLIRTPGAPRTSFAEFFHRWRSAWLVPVAAALVIAAGIKLYHPAGVGDTNAVAKHSVAPPRTAPAATVSADDKDLLTTVASRPPAQQASYRRSLDEANNFIRDAEESVRNDPNDVYSQQLLLNAYEQKQMLYDLAVSRSIGEQ